MLSSSDYQPSIRPWNQANRQADRSRGIERLAHRLLRIAAEHPLRLVTA